MAVSTKTFVLLKVSRLKSMLAWGCGAWNLSGRCLELVHEEHWLELP